MKFELKTSNLHLNLNLNPYLTKLIFTTPYNLTYRLLKQHLQLLPRSDGPAVHHVLGLLFTAVGEVDADLTGDSSHHAVDGLKEVLGNPVLDCLGMRLQSTLQEYDVVDEVLAEAVLEDRPQPFNRVQARAVDREEVQRESELFRVLEGLGRSVGAVVVEDHHGLARVCDILGDGFEELVRELDVGALASAVKDVLELVGDGADDRDSFGPHRLQLLGVRRLHVLPPPWCLLPKMRC